MRLPNGALYRWRLAKTGETLSIAVGGPITLDEGGLARSAALGGLGIGCFLEPDVEADIAAGRLVGLLEDWTPPFLFEQSLGDVFDTPFGSPAAVAPDIAVEARSTVAYM